MIDRFGDFWAIVWKTNKQKKNRQNNRNNGTLGLDLGLPQIVDNCARKVCPEVGVTQS